MSSIQQSSFQQYLDLSVHQDKLACSFMDDDILASSDVPLIPQGGDVSFIKQAFHAIIGKIHTMTQLDEDKKNRTVDLVLNTLETIPLVLQDISNCSTTAQVIGAFIRAYKMFTQSCVMSTFANNYDWITERVTTVLAKAQFGDSTLSIQSDTGDRILKGAKSLLSNYKKIKESAGVQRILELLKYFLTFGIFQSLGLTFKCLDYDKYQQKDIKKEHGSILDFLYYTLESIVWFVERSIQAVKTGSFSPFLHSRDTYCEWADNVNRIMEDAAKVPSAGILLCPNRTAHTPDEKEKCETCKKFGDLDEHDFLHRLTKCLDEGEAIMKFVEDKTSKRLIQAGMRELRLIEAKFLSKDKAQEDRLPPFTVLVHGDSSVAKTMFMNMMFSQYAKVHNKDASASCMYTRSPQDQYWSGFKSYKWCVRLDDVAMYKPTGTTTDPTMSELIQIGNGVVFVAPMAAVEDKGVHAVRPELVLASTNCSHLNAASYFTYPLAVRRRFPNVVRLRIKEEFRIAGTRMLDVSSVDVPPGEFQDIWDIEILEMKVNYPEQDRSESNLDPMPEIRLEPMNLETDPDLPARYAFHSIDEYLVWFSHKSKAHLQSQTRAQDTANHMAAIPICHSCYYRTDLCQCNQLTVQTQEYDNAEIEIEGVPIMSDDYYCQMVHRARNGELTADEIKGFVRAIRASDIHKDQTQRLLVRMDGEEEELAEDELIAGLPPLFQRSLPERFMDMVDDTRVNAITAAKMMALGVWHYAKDTTDRVLTYASDLVIYYQLKKLKETFAQFGQDIYEAFSNPVVIGFCTLLIGGFAVWKSCSSMATMLQGGCDEDTLENPEDIKYVNRTRDGVKEQHRKEVATKKEEAKVQGNTVGRSPAHLAKDEKENCWIKTDFVLSPMQVPTMASGWKNLTQHEIEEKIRSNVYHGTVTFNVESGIKHVPFTATCLVGHVYMTNNHCIPVDKDMRCHLHQGPALAQVVPTFEFSLKEANILRLPDNDICFFWCPYAPRADLRGLVPKQSVVGLECNGFYTHCRPGEKPWTNCVKNIHSKKQVVALLGGSKKVENFVSLPKVPTIFGDCGSPLIAMSPQGPLIVGIHQNWSGAEAGCTAITQELLVNLEEFFGTQIQCGIPSFVPSVGELHHKSVLRWPKIGHATVYGSTARASWRQAPKSKVVPTYICSAAQAKGFIDRCDKPVMKGPEVWFKNVEPTLTSTSLLDKSILDLCINVLGKHIGESLPADQLAEMFPLDDKSTLNGYPGVKFIDKVNRDTSMGYPYRKSKREFLVPVEPDEIYQDAVKYTPEVMQEVAEIREKYERGERAMPVFVMSLKDEATNEAKILMQKTRGFMGGPAAWQFVVRQNLLTFVRVFQNNSQLFMGAPGLNCKSCSWKHLYQFLTKFGLDQMVAGDYAKFDKRMEAMMILSAYEVIKVILKKAGWTEEQLKIISCIAEDTAYPVTDVQGDFVMFNGSNPSGNALTVILNCIVNVLYLMYTYFQLNPEHEVGSFFLHVALMTYGDDNVFGVSKEIPWFNHTSISANLLKIGVVYTMADKESESVPYINIEQVSFLKRRFVIDEDKVRCPLEWSSIEKMLTKCVKSDSIGPEAQAIDTIRSAVGEFYEYGPKVFEENVQKMKDIVSTCDLWDYVKPSTFPTYEDLEVNYYKNSSGCQVCPQPCE